MPTELILAKSATDEELAAKRAQLAAVRGQLADMEAELAQVRAQLRVFEERYFRHVGVIYAELDEWEARIAEREAERSGSAEERQRAAEARRRAQETVEANALTLEEEPEGKEPSGSLKGLFREVAKRIHPDFARDEDEREFFTLLMARANQAYQRGDSELLQRLLDDHGEIHHAEAGDTAAAEMLRIARQIRHAERDMAALDYERYALLAGEVGQMYADVQAAAQQHRDLLTELATKVRAEIGAAHLRWTALTREEGS